VTVRRGAFALVLLALAPAFRGEAAEPPGDSCPSHLFVLGRSKNANVVVYDANRDPAGDLASSDPVVAYWLLSGESGPREELNLVERQRAYGFDLTPGETPGTFEMAFKAGRSRRLVVRMLNGCPVATGAIGGHDGVLRRMFVQSTEGSIQPRIEYVEFFGENLTTGRPLYERFIPGKR
jgi:hypothetical protein